MNPPTWHAPTPLLTRYVAAPEELDEATAASVEQHLLACATCRAGAAAAADHDALEVSWALVADRIDRPPASLAERVLRLLGVRADHARLVAATPALRFSTVVAVVAIAVGLAVMARASDADGPYLTVAPLLPLLVVAMVFAGGGEPGGEVGLATPVHGAGLLLRRAAAVLIPTFVVLGLATVVLPTVGVVSLAWVLPALALVLGSLAVGTWWPVERTAAAAAAGWVVLVSAAQVVEGGQRVAQLAAFGPPGQLAALLAAVVAGAVLLARWDHLTTRVPS